jgi:DNA replication protein DnaC
MARHGKSQPKKYHITSADRKSKPIRVSKDLLERLSAYKPNGSTWNRAIEEVLTQASGPTYWTLPSYTFDTKKAAIKEAMEQTVLRGKEFEDMEKPIKVRG